MIYYQVLLYTNKKDLELENGIPVHGGLRGIKWLIFNGDDKGMQIDEERDDEALAIKILMQNLGKVETELLATNDLSEQHLIGTTERYIKNEADLIDLLHGKYEAA